METQKELFKGDAHESPAKKKEKRVSIAEAHARPPAWRLFLLLLRINR